MGRMSCEEWFARLRRLVASATPPRVVRELDQRKTLDLVTVKEFHRECVRVVARMAVRRGRG